MVIRIPFTISRWGLDSSNLIDFPNGLRLWFCDISSAKYRRIVKRHPEDMYASQMFAFLLSRERRYPDAINEYLRAVEMAGSLPDQQDRESWLEDIYYHLGNVYEEIGSQIEARKYWTFSAQSGTGPMAYTAQKKLKQLLARKSPGLPACGVTPLPKPRAEL